MIADGEYRIDFYDMDINPSPLGEMHLKDRWFPVFRSTLGKRLVRVNDNDMVSADLPLLHHSIVERILQDESYRPENLMATPHLVLEQDNSVTLHQGLEDHLP
jgi:hypothetical protein